MKGQAKTSPRPNLGQVAGLVLMAMGVSLAGTRTSAQTTAERTARSGQGAASGIRDTAGVFSADAIAAARTELERIEVRTGAATMIETIDSLKGEPPEEAAVTRARRSGIQGLFILIARKERKLEVLVSRPYRDIVTEARRRAIREAFFEGFHREDFNEGLRRGVAAVGDALASVRRPAPLLREMILAPTPGPSSSAPSNPAADSGLVLRNQVHLTLAGARAILGGAEAKAQSLGLKVNIAVVDDGGHLLAFERMDGARPASGYTAQTKATAAATLRQPTGPLPAGSTNPDLHLNLSLQNAATASGGKITTLYGGVPVVVDGQVIGGVGVGGGSGEQDAQIARAGIQALLDHLAAPRAASGEKPDASPVGPRDGASTRREDSSF